MKAESSAGCEKLAITPSTAQEPNKSDSSRSQDGSSDDKPKMTDKTKKSVPDISTKHQKHDQSSSKNIKSVKNKEENNFTGGDKSERSSSPAFDSDEDSLGFSNQPQEQVALCANKKRAPSIGILLNTAHSSFFASKLNNSRVNETLPTSATTIHQQQQTVEVVIDSHSQKHEEMNKQSKNQYQKSSIENELKSISMPVTPETNDETTTFVHRKEERTKSLTKNFTPSLSTFIVDKNSRPNSIISEGEPSKDLFDDFVSRMDGADLKFMEEGSGMLSPTIDSPSTNISIYRHHHNVNNNQNNNIVTNPSLLQKALIKATAQTKQPSPTVLMKSLENLQENIPSTTAAVVEPLSNRISPTTSIKSNKNVTISILKSTPNPQQHAISSTQQINKLTLEVSVANQNDNKLVTTIKNDSSFTDVALINNVDDDVQNSTNKTKNLHNSSKNRDDDDNENILSLDSQQNVGNRSAESHNTNNNHNNNNKNTSSNEKKSFVQRIRKTLRLNGKKKTGQFLGFAGNRQKSKSENRARKAFRTISFILGAFVCSSNRNEIVLLIFKAQNLISFTV
jgi:muscarinic acetylcholine receptor M3